MLHYIRSMLLGVTMSLCSIPFATAEDVTFESKYLSTTVAGFHGYAIAGELGGSAKLMLDPNACGLDIFGDRTVCTRIALTVEDVHLVGLDINDPTGQKRRVFGVTDHQLPGDLKLITTESADDGWLVYTQRNGERTVIAMDSAVVIAALGDGVAKRSPSDSCVPLSRTVDGTKAQLKVVPGFVNGTWFLIVQGKKPNGGTRVEFRPVFYVQRPDYWLIRVSECSDGITLPVVSPYDASFDITPYLGKKGIDVVFGDETVRLEVPPSKKKK